VYERPCPNGKSGWWTRRGNRASPSACVVEERQLAHSSGEADRKLAAWVTSPKRTSATAVPLPAQDTSTRVCWGALGQLRDGGRSAVDDTSTVGFQCPARPGPRSSAAPSRSSGRSPRWFTAYASRESVRCPDHDDDRRCRGQCTPPQCGAVSLRVREDTRSADHRACERVPPMRGCGPRVNVESSVTRTPRRGGRRRRPQPLADPLKDAHRLARHARVAAQHHSAACGPITVTRRAWSAFKGSRPPRFGPRRSPAAPPPRASPRFRRAGDRVGAIGVHERVLEQAQLELLAQEPPHGGRRSRPVTSPLYLFRPGCMSHSGSSHPRLAASACAPLGGVAAIREASGAG